MFDTFLGLPVHPLAVHLPVVLLPLGAASLLLMAFSNRWRLRLALPAFLVLAVGTLGAGVAMLSGDELAARVGDPALHATLGKALTFVSLAYLLGAGAWLWWTRGVELQSPRQRLAGFGVAAASIVVIGLTAATGHLGATSVWSGVGAADRPTASPGASTAAPRSSSPSAVPTAPSSSATPTTGSPTAQGYTMAAVETHNSAESCWAAIDGEVYDLTNWIDLHPGGREEILSLCGTDATVAFNRQHAGQPQPAERLAGFALGPLAG